MIMKEYMAYYVHHDFKSLSYFRLKWEYRKVYNIMDCELEEDMCEIMKKFESDRAGTYHA